MDRRAYLTLVASAGLGGCVGLGNTSTTTPDYDVGMRASAFVPRQFEVEVGGTVTWRNTSSRPHTVTAYDDLIPEDAEYFASGGYESEQAARDGYNGGLGGAIYTDETYEHAFEVAGTYHYVCVPHERQGMVGSVVVE